MAGKVGSMNGAPVSWHSVPWGGVGTGFGLAKSTEPMELGRNWEKKGTGCQRPALSRPPAEQTEGGGLIISSCSKTQPSKVLPCKKKLIKKDPNVFSGETKKIDVSEWRRGKQQ